ncbi:hypothetical protein QWY28_10110 [Nocardioides sp. SOB77]|uniref:DUF3558 domain-containing protein n=1 Tax=Nocardioides oceani TaxID=3058369 RepID=A0ABT8FF31_9ACTN|nr:hypothetical protein [Nocardioides oceani]MDN4173296.1 hypothetical protein [Nocardioides oceani]
MRRALAVPLASLASLALLAGCSGDGPEDTDDPGAAPASAGSPHGAADATATPGSSPTVASWNPCDDLDPAEVGRVLGEEVTEEDGEPGAMRCSYLPVADGGATLDVNYLWFDGSFEDAWDSIGTDIAGTVRDVDLPTADAARTVEQVTDDAVLVTGFVQTGGLIESVNALVLDPTQRDRLVRATREVLRLLSERAPERAAD